MSSKTRERFIAHGIKAAGNHMDLLMGGTPPVHNLQCPYTKNSMEARCWWEGVHVVDVLQR